MEKDTNVFTPSLKGPEHAPYYPASHFLQNGTLNLIVPSYSTGYYNFNIEDK